MTTHRQRIGVYGGTFDPVHYAHLDMARAALDTAELDRVLFVVSGRPPHKGHDSVAGAEDRFAMVAAALEDEPRMEASRIEIDRPGPSYMADTLAELLELHPGAELFLIIGMDALADLPHWNRPGEILDRAHLLAVPRPGNWELDPVLDGHYTLLPFRETLLSSTGIRERMARDGRLEDLVPPGALRVMRERGLYDNAAL
jgi:nicotinate-nucleotide adenylyltransferase